MNDHVTTSTAGPSANSRIATRADLEAHLDALVARDPALAGMRAQCGEIPLRLIEPGYGALCRIVCSQLLSVAAARAIHERVTTHFGTVTGAAVLAEDEAVLVSLGLGRAKARALKAIAMAVQTGKVDLQSLHRLPPDEARRVLTALPGVGPWTADIYCLTAAGHADIFPAGDLALRKMVGTMGRFAALPAVAETREYAARWAPHRSAAARLMWQQFAAQKHKEGLAL